MSFFYAPQWKEAQAKPKTSRAARRDIPIASLRQLGCSVCPRDADHNKLDHPKMEATGSRKPLVYLLGTGPNLDEDRSGEHWVGKAGDVILSKLSRSFVKKEVRFGHLTQCSPLRGDPDLDLRIEVAEMECCRPRVVRDIEESKPRVIVGVGDQPLRWATDYQEANAKTFRGRFFAVRIGSHVCWFYPIMWPNFINRKNYGKSEYEWALEHDLANLEKLLDSGELGEPAYHAGGYDRGIEIITGQEAGDFQRLERALADLVSLEQSAVDIETNGLRVRKVKQPKIWTAAVGNFQRTVAFALDHPDGWGADSRIRKVWELFGEYLLWSGEKSAHNLAMELEWLSYFYGDRITRSTMWADTMAMAHTFDERPGTKSLDVQCLINFGFQLKNQSQVDVRRPEWWSLYPLREILRYNGMDTKWTDGLRDHYTPILEQMPLSQWEEYERKVRLASTLVLMENKGMPVDLDYARDLDERYAEEAADALREIRRCPEIKKYEQRFGSFNPGNPEHVLKMLRDICKREEIKRKDRDGVESESSDEDVLSSLPAHEVPSAPLILTHRGVEKLRSTYVGPVLSGKSLSLDGRIHCKYSSMVAVTGRLAAEDPAVQNWPARTNIEVRGMVTAERRRQWEKNRGWILAVDYGQIEARCFAMASLDERLIKYLWTDYDIHGHWAKRLTTIYPKIKDIIVRTFAVDWDAKGPKTLRQEMKNKWVFPLFFGAAAKRCAAELGIPLDIAEDLMAEFWDEFAGVKQWQKKLVSFFEKHLYVETLTGRRRRGPMSLNELLNHPIQGTAFDIVGAGMNAMSERAMEEENEELQQNLQVHDDNSFWISDETIEPAMEIIAHEMLQHRFDWINVPLLIEMKVGRRWSELEEVAKYRSDKLFNIRNPYA